MLQRITLNLMKAGPGYQMGWSWLAALMLCLAALQPVRGENPLLKTEFGHPPPSLEQPRKVLLVVNDGSKAAVNRAFNNAMNIQNFYGMNKIELVIIAYGPAIKIFYKNSTLRKRISSMQQYNIEFIACGNTLASYGKKPSDLLDGVGVVKAAIPEILERSLRGWLQFRP